MKKFTKILAALLAVSMALSVMPSALAGGLILSEPTYWLTADGPETEISAPVPGFVTTKIDASNSGDSDAGACLVVSATDNTTGKLLAIDVDTQTVQAKETKTLSKGINLGANQTYNYYVWKSIINHKPLLNTPPSSIKNLVCEPKTNSVDLSWDPSLDDKAIKNYVIKLNGKEVAKPKEASYSVLGLDMNSSYNFEVFASDEEGLTSASASGSATTYGIEDLILSEYDNESKALSFRKNHTNENADDYTIFEEGYAGRDCIKNIKLESKGYPGFFYISVASPCRALKTKKVAVEVTYFDDNLGNISMRYNSEASSGSSVVSFGNRTNTKTWKTAHVVVDNASFTSAGTLGGAAFRFEAPAETRIYKLAIAPGDEYAPDSPHVKFGDGVIDTYDMSFFPEDAKSVYGIDYADVGGSTCLLAPGGGNFEFNIPDEYATRTGGYIEVTYYDSGSDKLVLNYPNIKHEKPSVDFENTGSFKTVQFPLDAATFDNSITGAAGKKFDFKLYTKNGCSLAISSVKYVAGDSDYVPEVKTEIFSEMNEDGTDFEGDLALNSSFKYTAGDSGYDSCALFSGAAGRDPIDGKHYMFNKEVTVYNGGDPSWRRWKNAFYIEVPKTFLDGTNYGSVEITVELYTQSGSISLEYEDGTDTHKTITNSGITKGTWTTTTFVMDGSKNMQFNKGGFGKSSFRFNANNEELKIHKVTIKKND